MAKFISQSSFVLLYLCHCKAYCNTQEVPYNHEDTFTAPLDSKLYLKLQDLICTFCLIFPNQMGVDVMFIFW